MIRSHVLRNAMLPVVTMLGMDIAVSLGARPSSWSRRTGYRELGRLFATSLARRDFPVLLGITIYTTLVVILVNFLIDILYGFIDPRARLGSRSEAAPSRAERAEAGPRLGYSASHVAHARS